jgi:hypothetical protein
MLDHHRSQGKVKEIPAKKSGSIANCSGFWKPAHAAKSSFWEAFHEGTSGFLNPCKLENVPRQNVRRQNVRPQNVRRDKTSGEKTSGDLMSVGQNVRRTKRPAGQNVRRDKTSGGTKRPGGDQASFCKYKNKNNHFVYLVGHYIFRNLYVLQHVDSKKQYIASE